jgi:hypothetical protein
LRVELLQEELNELKLAIENDDLVWDFASVSHVWCSFRVWFER